MAITRNRRVYEVSHFEETTNENSYVYSGEYARMPCVHWEFKVNVIQH